MPIQAIRERSILVVDDEESVRLSLAAVLEREGYKVFTAEGGEDGLLLKLVRERNPGVVRMMLTGDPDPQIIIRSVNEGEVYRFIKKPWDNTMLRVTVYFAFETVQLETENRRLLAALRRQVSHLRDLERDFPYLAALTRDEDAALLLAEADLVQPGEG